MIRDVEIKNAKEIMEIYNYYIEETIITFETEKITEENMKSRITEIIKKYPFIVYEENDKIIGYAYVSRWRDRKAYDGVVESSIYLHKDYLSKGIGEQLYKRLIEITFDKGYYSIIGVISLPNEQSVKLHNKLGFEEVGTFKKVGYKFDKYIDVCFCELINKNRFK